MKNLFPQKYPVTCHTDNVTQGSTFIAIKGFGQKGTSYIEQAIKNGATKIVLDKTNEKIIKHKNITYLFVDNPRKALAELSSKALNNPAPKLKIIGITGTKGKTTTTYLIDHILKNCGYKTALLGTIKNKILDQEIQSKLTTPQSDFLHMFFNECVKQDINYVVMEVSAHALSLDRIHTIQFDAIGFTNLAPEHLDFYENMQNYFNAKCKIFDHIKKQGIIVINSDDEWCKKIASNLDLNNLTAFSQNKDFKIIQNNFKGLILNVLNSENIVTHNIFGEFNAYNIIMSFLICKKLKLPETKILNAIKTFNGVPGRMQKHILKNKALAFVDYAHNPSSFDAALKTLKNLNSNLIVVFGCGGDKDKTKRAVMGKIVSKYAKKIIITDDNPRYENKNQIIKDILKGIDSSQESVFCISDRSEAIKKAAELSNKNSIVAILGKGHENYYSVKGKTLYFDDFEEIKKY